MVIGVPYPAPRFPLRAQNRPGDDDDAGVPSEYLNGMATMIFTKHSSNARPRGFMDVLPPTGRFSVLVSEPETAHRGPGHRIYQFDGADQRRRLRR